MKVDRIIYKYPLSRNEHGWINVLLPRHAINLDIQFQADTCVLWALVNPHETEKVWRQFKVLLTGQDIPEGTQIGSHVKTLQAPNGLVYHIFNHASGDQVR